MSSLLISEIVIYLDETKPVDYLFGQPVARFNKDRRQFYSFKGICFVIQQASEKAKIEKKVSPHTLRHTFATHLLEDGLDIVTIKNLLGHQHIETTMIYLNVAQCDRYRAFSPLDTLYGIRKSNFNADPIAPSRQCPFLCADAAPVPDYATSTN